MMAFTPRMAGRSCAVALAALLVLALGPPTRFALAGRSASARASSTVPLMGVSISSVEPGALGEADRAIAQARALHAKVVRTEVPWSVLEPSGPNAIDPRSLAFMDRMMSDASADGIRVIVLVESTPCWASSAPASLLRTCAPGHLSDANAWPPTNPSDYASFVAYLAQRYGTRLGAIEIWNEPDHVNQHFFAGPEKPQRYAALVRSAYPAIKRANPNVPVLAGSLVGSNGAFLRALYAAGMKGYYDGLAVHYYNLTLASLRYIHEVQLANGDRTPLWLDEFGWSSCYPGQRVQAEQACVTSRVQATNLTNTLRALSRTPYIAAEVVYELKDASGENFGVLSRSGAHKRAFGALARVFASPFGPVSRVALSLHRRGGHVLASGSGPVGDYMQLEAFHHGQLRYTALFTLDRFNRYSITLPRALGTSGLQVRVYQYWAGSGRAARRSI
jgi:polysaccharide biosynthesis protein PslG